MELGTGLLPHSSCNVFALRRPDSSVLLVLNICDTARNVAADTRLMVSTELACFTLATKCA